jgi:hypothetical protein
MIRAIRERRIGAASEDTDLRDDQYRRQKPIIEAVLVAAGRPDRAADSLLHRSR